MATVKRFEDLEIWKLARELENKIFLLTNRVLFAKDLKLVSQINSATGSIMDNIAEGFGRGSRLELLNFLTISKGSTEEVKSQLYRSFDRNYITSDELDEHYKLAELICRKIFNFIKYLNSNPISGLKFKDRQK